MHIVYCNLSTWFDNRRDFPFDDIGSWLQYTPIGHSLPTDNTMTFKFMNISVLIHAISRTDYLYTMGRNNICGVLSGLPVIGVFKNT